MEKKLELIFCVVNAGFSEAVMTAARREGATGGTVLKGRGTARREAEQQFGIAIQPDKEIVMLLVPSGIKDAVLRSIYDNAGLDAEAHGIAFSLPVDRAMGLTDLSLEQKPKKAEKDPPPEEK